MEFEWDPGKAASNLAKHGVDFPTATKVFDDPNIRLGFDPRPRGETRYQAIGSVSRVVLFVSYTMRGEVCRIISARRASRRERQSHPL
jgi:uncharacterized DUF497 family protein